MAEPTGSFLAALPAPVLALGPDLGKGHRVVASPWIYTWVHGAGSSKPNLAPCPRVPVSGLR